MRSETKRRLAVVGKVASVGTGLGLLAYQTYLQHLRTESVEEQEGVLWQIHQRLATHYPYRREARGRSPTPFIPAVPTTFYVSDRQEREERR